jgi:hypothetical protein
LFLQELVERAVGVASKLTQVSFSYKLNLPLPHTPVERNKRGREEGDKDVMSDRIEWEWSTDL